MTDKPKGLCIHERLECDICPTDTPTTAPKTPFALPCQVSEYQTDFVVHDARWRRIAAFPRKQEGGRERADTLCNALNGYDALAASHQTLLKAARHTSRNIQACLGAANFATARAGLIAVQRTLDAAIEAAEKLKVDLATRD